jgi:NitT/TauT family transport system ATP-binding protein
LDGAVTALASGALLEERPPSPLPDAALAMLRLDGVSKGFASRGDRKTRQRSHVTVLDDISFEVQPGEVVSLLGASGCGKTTLLRIIAGLIAPDRGAVTVQNAAVAAPRRDLCMVFQHANLLPWRSILANVAFPLEIDGVSRRDREASARKYLDLVGLAGFEQHYPHELSGGMQQRVGLARGLIRQPLVLLMDEPFGALDAQTREQLQEDFLGIWQQLKTTVVLVTHSIEEALLLSDRVIVLASRPGRIRQTIVPSFAKQRAAEDVRRLPEFGLCAREIRDLLRVERAP